jgi:hypothetical protein
VAILVYLAILALAIPVQVVIAALEHLVIVASQVVVVRLFLAVLAVTWRSGTALPE